MTRSQVLKLWESTPDPAKLVAEQYSLGFDNGFLALSWLISNLLGRHRRLYVFVSQGLEEEEPPVGRKRGERDLFLCYA